MAFHVFNLECDEWKSHKKYQFFHDNDMIQKTKQVNFIYFSLNLIDQPRLESTEMFKAKLKLEPIPYLYQEV